MESKLQEIQAKLKEVNENLTVDFCYEKEKYIIYHKGYYFFSTAYGDFDSKTLENIRKTIWLNENTDILNEIDSFNDKYEKSIDTNIEEITRETAKDICKYIKKNM
jgi:hypothetical protein